MKKLLFTFIFIPLVFLVSCTSNSYTKITAAEGKDMMDNDSSIVLVDVRTQEEYDEIHIPGAILLPLAEIEARADDIIPDMQGIYIIYCNSGNRSAQAAQILVDLGYENIYDMGGIIYWPYETVS